MNNRTSLLSMAFLCGLLLGVFGGIAPELLALTDGSSSTCHTAPCFLYAEFQRVFPVMLICGGALACATLMLAKGLHRLFYGENT